MANLIKQIQVFRDGTFKIIPKNLPAGYFLAQIGEHQTAPSGMPAVIMLRDLADTVYNEQWQLAHYAHNFGALKNNICNPFGYRAALANKTGFGNPDDPKRNYILGEDLNALKDMHIDKLRTFSLNNHAVRNYDNEFYQMWAQDGSINPIMKPGKLPPSSVEDIDNGKVKSTDYLYNPKETLFAFLVCKDFDTKPGDLTTISPFPGGIKYSWTPDPNENYLFVPFVSRHPEPILSPKWMWKKFDTYQSQYRRL